MSRPCWIASRGRSPVLRPTRARGARHADRARLHRRRSRGRTAEARTVFPRISGTATISCGSRAHDAAVQFRVRLLLPGGPRRLQQVRRQDVARDGGARRRVDQRAARRAPAREIRAHAVWRRAALQYSRRCRHRRAAVEESSRAASQLHVNIITNGLLLTPDVVDGAPLRVERGEDHARRRPRHPQSDAAAPRRPGHVRQSSIISPWSPAAAGLPLAAIHQASRWKAFRNSSSAG